MAVKSPHLCCYRGYHPQDCVPETWGLGHLIGGMALLPLDFHTGCGLYSDRNGYRFEV